MTHLICSSSCQVIKQYHDREKEIAKMRAAVEQQEQQEQQLIGDVTEMRNRWLTPLKELIERISENFGHFFTAMDCCGEVDLSIPEDQVSGLSS